MHVLHINLPNEPLSIAENYTIPAEPRDVTRACCFNRGQLRDAKLVSKK